MANTASAVRLRLKRLLASRHRERWPRAREAAELVVAKRNFEGHISPEIARDSEVTLKAVKELEQGGQKAIDKIAERAGLTKGLNTRRYSSR